MRSNKGVVFTGFTSTVAGIALSAVSTWTLYHGILAREFQIPRFDDGAHLTTFLNALMENNSSGLNFFDQLPFFNGIIISCSASTLAGAIIQFLASICLILYEVAGKMDPQIAKWWVRFQILSLLAIGGSIICAKYNELEMKTYFSLYIFLLVSLIDISLILVNCVIMAFSNCQGRPTRDTYFEVPLGENDKNYNFYAKYKK